MRYTGELRKRAPSLLGEKKKRNGEEPKKEKIRENLSSIIKTKGERSNLSEKEKRSTIGVRGPFYGGNKKFSVGGGKEEQLKYQ